MQYKETTQNTFINLM